MSSVWHAFTSEGHLVGDDATGRVQVHHADGTVSERDFTDAERDVRDERIAGEARMDDHEARITALEAAVWPPDPDPPGGGADVPTWQERGGVWPHGTLLSDGGRVWRNVSGVPLTTAPTGFPGSPEAWAHLFVEVTTPDGPDPDPDPGDHPDGYVGPWDKNTRYEIGDVVDSGGHYYRCKVPHGAEYQGTWAPPAHAVWTDLGPTQED